MFGTPTKITEWIHGDLCVVKVEVDAISVDDDNASPYLKPDTVRHLERVQLLADRGDISELTKLGTVYVRQSA